MITRDPVDQLVCANGAATFEASASSSTPVSYQWRKDGVPITGATDRTISINGVVEQDAGQYDVIVMNQCSQAISTAASLNVFGAKIVGNPGELRAEKCMTVTFSVVPAGLPPYFFQWQKDGIPLVDDDRYHGSQSESLSIGPVIRTDSGAYDVLVTTSCGDIGAMRNS
jgi:hypothetical protein